MGEAIRVTFDRILRNFRLRMRALFQGNLFGATFDDVISGVISVSRSFFLL
jgi:hypothetical protein